MMPNRYHSESWIQNGCKSLILQRCLIGILCGSINSVMTPSSRNWWRSYQSFWTKTFHCQSQREPSHPFTHWRLHACLEDLEVSCMFLRTFTAPRRPAVIGFYSPLMRNVANSLLATVTGHAGRCFFCDVGLQRAPPGVGLSIGISCTLLILCRETTLYGFAALPNKFC